MPHKPLRCAILGAQEQDLPVLAALRNRPHTEIAFVYDRDRQAVGVDMAEIIGVLRFHTPDELTDLKDLDYAIVSEPREKFSTEIEILSRANVKLLNPSEVFQQLLPADSIPRIAEVKESSAPRTIDETFAALEKLLDRTEVLKFLLDVAVESTRASAGSLMLYSSETQELYIAYAIGLSERVIKRTRQRLGKGIAGRVAQTKQAQLLTTPGETPYYTDSRERVDIGSAISVPLVWGERLLGVLNVSVSAGNRQLDDTDFRKLKALSRRLSRVLDQSINLEETQMRHREWKFRSTMGEIATKTIPTQEKFSVLARYLSDLIGADTVEIFLNTREGDWFVLGGSNRLLSPKDERVRYQAGALGRAFLDNRCIVLAEGGSAQGEWPSSLSSMVYCPMGAPEPQGVVAVEFGERYKLDEFLLIREGIILEISRFLASEMKERRLNRELRALRLIADAASSVLACRTAQNLADIVASTTALALESQRISVRLRQGLSEDNYAESSFGVPTDGILEFKADDHNRFLALAKERKAFSTAFLTFEPGVRDDAPRYRSVLAFPLENEDGFFGGIMAYDKSPDDPLEDAVYSELDRKVLANLSALVLPVLDAILRRAPTVGRGETGAYDLVLVENVERFKTVCDDEINRSDRYHQAFTLVLFRMPALSTLFERDRARALSLAEDITQGLETRTRKTDFGAWIRPDTYVIITLDGGRRIRFLLSRVTTYLAKDLSTLTDFPQEQREILIGSAGYPGSAKTADELLAEAEKNLSPISHG